MTLVFSQYFCYNTQIKSVSHHSVTFAAVSVVQEVAGGGATAKDIIPPSYP